jgi:hypothetical protein
MIIITADGPRNIGIALLTPYKIPAAVTKLERQWRDAWNTSAVDFNLLVERTQQRYGRMMDVALLKLIPENETKIPE